MRGYRKWQTLETGRYNAKSGGHFSYLRVKIVNFDHSLTCTLFGTHQKCDIYRTFFRFYRRKLGIPIDRVPTSESCVFCLGKKFLFFSHLTVSWALPPVRIIFLKRCYACN